MIKPLWAVAGLALLGTAGVAGVLVVASSGGEEEVVQQVETATAAVTATPTAVAPSATPVAPRPSPSATPSCAAKVPAGSQLWRWIDVTIAVPEDSGLTIARTSLSPGEVPGQDGPVIRLIMPDPSSGVRSEIYVDANDGRVLKEQLSELDQPAMAAVLETICLEPDPDEEVLPWPYSGSAPSHSKVQEQPDEIRYWEPDPGSGIVMLRGCGLSGGCFFNISNGRSFMQIDGETGGLNVTEADKMAPEDDEAFGRWRGAIEPVGP